MKTTMGLSWKSLVSKIHPPLPMSPQESARLLALLNDSFKRQLNQQHPTGLPGGEHHTNLHLRSILTNPLFDVNFRASRKIDGSFGRIQDLLNRPMGVFKEQVSAGTATPEMARFCLQTQYKNCLASPSSTPATPMGDSKAGTTVLEWLWSSGIEGSGDFLEMRDLVDLLISFLVAEQRYDPIWRWLQRLRLEARERQPKADVKFQKTLLQFIKSEVTMGQGLESATAFFVRFSRDTRQQIGNANGLGMAGWYLTNELSRASKTPDLQKNTMEPFMEVFKTHDASLSLIRAYHGIHLAKDPEPESALEYFKSVSSRKLTRLKPLRMPHVLLMGLKAAEICLEKGRQADAIFVMDFLQTNFGNEIGSPTSQRHVKEVRRSSEELEARSIHQLDGLVVA